MNPFIYTLTCDICGEEGAATSNTAGMAWVSGVRISHSNPAICSSVLARRQREIERREKALAEKELSS